MVRWNLWHGCRKISDGCKNCYMYRQDSVFERDSTEIKKTLSFDAPIKKRRNGEYKIPSGETLYTCFTSDFFIEEADAWREEAWEIIRKRQDLKFFIITKRIERFYISLPEDWKDGYDNVCIACTVENQKAADLRLPIYLNLPIKRKIIICEPILEQINLIPYLSAGSIYEVVVGGESGEKARICDYSWVLNIRDQCIEYNVNFRFKQTGYNFKKGNTIYRILRKSQESQAQKANIDVCFD